MTLAALVFCLVPTRLALLLSTDLDVVAAARPLIIGPICDCGSLAGPTLSALTRAASLAAKVASSSVLALACMARRSS